MEKTRLNLKDAVQDLAPPPPPCFLNHMQWREYLTSAAAAQACRGEPKVILVQNREPLFNSDFPFCADCTAKKSHQMSTQGKCNPNFLKELK